MLLIMLFVVNDAGVCCLCCWCLLLMILVFVVNDVDMCCGGDDTNIKNGDIMIMLVITLQVPVLMMMLVMMMLMAGSGAGADGAEETRAGDGGTGQWVG